MNAWILYCKKTGNRISRRKLLVQLLAELRHKVQPEEDADGPPAPKERRVLHKQVNCQVKSHCVRNRTQVLCNKCNLPVCGQCIAKLCSKCI